MRDIIVLTWGFASIPISFFKPFYGMVVFSILSYNRTQDLTWGVAADYRLTFYVAVAMMVGFLLRPPGGKLIVLERRTWVMLVLLILITLSVVYAQYPKASYHKFYEFIKVMIVAMITPPLLNSKERIRYLLWAIALSLGFYGVKNGLLFQRTLRGPGGMLLDNNDFSSALVMNLPILLYLGKTETKKWVKRGLYGAVPLTVIAVALTESRGGFLALCLVLGVLVLKSNQRVIAMTIAPFAAIAFLALMPQSFRDRLETLKNPTEDSSAQARLEAWGTALRMSEDHPWIGVGYRNFQTVYNDYSLVPGARERVAHNSYLQLMAESGRPALAVFLLLIFMTVANSRSLQWEGRRRYGPNHWFVNYAAAIEVALYGYLLSGIFLNRAHFDLLYHMIAISIALNAIARAEVRADMREKAAEQEIQPGGLAYGTGL